MNSLIFLGWTIAALGIIILTYKLFGPPGLFGMIAASVVLMNIFVTKSVIILGIGATGGNVLYAAIYFSTDILSEHHGKKMAQKGVLIGFIAALFGLLASVVTIIMKPAPWDFASDALTLVLSPMFRIVLGSMLAYIISQRLDTNIYAWLKKIAPKHLWLRNNGSTMTSQAVDTAVFCSVALLGSMPFEAWLQVCLSTYLIKIIIAGIDTPFLYLTKKTDGMIRDS